LGPNKQDDDSDGETDETSKHINSILNEFSTVRSVVDKLFNVLDKFVFKNDKSAIKLV